MERAPVDFTRRAARLALAVGRRQRWRLDELIRSRLYGSTPVFERRAAEPIKSTRAAPARLAPAVAGRPGGVPGVVAVLLDGKADGTNALAATAEYYGLDLENWIGPDATGRLGGGDVGGGSPLLGLCLEGLESLPDAWTALVQKRLAQGSTVLLNGVVAPEPLRSLLRYLGVDADVSDRPAGVQSVTFAADRPDFSAELAGLALETSTEAPVLSVGDGAILAYANGSSSARPVVVEMPVGPGRVVIHAGTQRLGTDLANVFESGQVLAVLPAMMLARQVYGDTAWHSPLALADLVIDDPVLHNGRLGIDYPGALMATEAADFHLTVAAVPRELPLAEPDVVRLLALHPERLSACYHGNDHAGYEFYRSSSGGRRFRSRPFPAQRSAIQEAADRGRRFARSAGYGLDRVMVFPHGIGAGDLLPSLGEAGFLASCNWLDRYPLEAAQPEDRDLGLRPADVAWGGFPLLWRRRPTDTAGFALDLFLGRPAIAFGHRKRLGSEFGWARDLAAGVNGLAINRRVFWRGLEEIARHAYQQRRAGPAWKVLMTANEICLHNPNPQARAYSVCRPHAPRGARLLSDSADAVSRADELVVTVMPGGRAVVRLVVPGSSDLPRPEGTEPQCTLPD